MLQGNDSHQIGPIAADDHRLALSRDPGQHVGILARRARFIDTARLGATDPSNIGGGMEFAGIAAAVIGGTPFSGGRAPIGGAVVGALIMAVLATSLNMLRVPFAWSLIIQAAIILAAVYVQRPRTA